MFTALCAQRADPGPGWVACWGAALPRRRLEQCAGNKFWSSGITLAFLPLPVLKEVTALQRDKGKKYHWILVQIYYYPLAVCVSVTINLLLLLEPSKLILSEGTCTGPCIHLQPQLKCHLFCQTFLSTQSKIIHLSITFSHLHHLSSSKHLALSFFSSLPYYLSLCAESSLTRMQL